MQHFSRRRKTNPPRQIAADPAPVRATPCNAMQPGATPCNSSPDLEKRTHRAALDAFGAPGRLARRAVDTGLRGLTRVDAGLPRHAKWKNEPKLEETLARCAEATSCATRPCTFASGDAARGPDLSPTRDSRSTLARSVCVASARNAPLLNNCARPLAPAENFCSCTGFALCLREYQRSIRAAAGGRLYFAGLRCRFCSSTNPHNTLGPARPWGEGIF